MQRFNLVLLPQEVELQNLFSKISLPYFGEHQDGYILADGALAHVTLCQFRVESEEAALDAFRSFDETQDITLGIEQFRLRLGTDEHTGYFWAEYLVEKKQVLLDMQRRCFDHLVKEGCEALTPVETYSPHITLARVSIELTQFPSVDEIANRTAITFRSAVGLSTENGLLVREL